MECPKCSSTQVRLKLDSRGIPDARCAVCDAYIKKMSSREVVEYYEALMAEGGENTKLEPNVPEDKPKCRFCSEDYFTRYGRLGVTYVPVPAEYCPMCGRKINPKDRDY